MLEQILQLALLDPELFCMEHSMKEYLLALLAVWEFVLASEGTVGPDDQGSSCHNTNKVFCASVKQDTEDLCDQDSPCDNIGKFL